MNNDLISRSALLTNAIEMEIFQPYGGDGSCMGVTVGTIECAPAVDAVEVVRCRDCKHWIIDSYWNGNPDRVRACKFAGWICGANGYCMYGERKMDAEVEG